MCEGHLRVSKLYPQAMGSGTDTELGGPPEAVGAHNRRPRRHWRTERLPWKQAPCWGPRGAESRGGERRACSLDRGQPQWTVGLFLLTVRSSCVRRRQLLCTCQGSGQGRSPQGAGRGVPHGWGAAWEASAAVWHLDSAPADAGPPAVTWESETKMDLFYGERRCAGSIQWSTTQPWKRTACLPFAATWLDLEGILVSERSQTEKDKCCMISLMWNLKNTANYCCSYWVHMKQTHR